MTVTRRYRKAKKQAGASKRKAMLAALRVEKRFAELNQPTMLQTKTWRRTSRQTRSTATLITTAPGHGGLGTDPARIVAYRIRAALRPPDPSRTASPARRIDPATGRVISTIDPVTRIETPVAP